jgi:hypothetical protein
MDIPLNAQSSAPLAVDELMATGPGKILHAWGRYVVQQKAYSCATPFFGSNKDIGSSNIAGLEAKPEEPTETKADPALIHNNVASEVWEVDEPVIQHVNAQQKMIMPPSRLPYGMCHFGNILCL